MRSGEAKADALASTDRDRSNTSLAAVSSCESRTPTATGAPASPANPLWSDIPIRMRTARAASRPIRAIPVPPSAPRRCSSSANAAPAQTPGAQSAEQDHASKNERETPLRRVNEADGVMLAQPQERRASGAGKSQTGKELANALDGAYLRRVTNSDRIRAVGSFCDRAGICRDHRVMAFRPREQRRGGLSTHWIACLSRWSGERVPAGRRRRKPGSTCRTKAGGAARIVTWAPSGAA